jgi:hypothetical protein
MASERKIAANRRNAQKSTGPRSDAGKKTLKPQCVSPWPRRRSRAFRGCAAQSEALAREIADASTNSVLVATDPEVLAFARLAALAELDFAHIRALRACNISALAAAADWPVAVFSQGAGATAASSATLVLNEREGVVETLRSSDFRPAGIRPLREARYRALRSSDASDHCEGFACEASKQFGQTKPVQLQAELSQSRGTRLPQNKPMGFGRMPQRASSSSKCHQRLEFFDLLGFRAPEWLTSRPVRLCLATCPKVAAIVNADKPCRLGEESPPGIKVGAGVLGSVRVARPR